MSCRLARVPALVLGVIAAALLGSPVLAQSPDPSLLPSPAPATPVASPRPDPCARLAALPTTLDDLPLDVTVSEGVADIDPDDLLDPLLVGLGRTRADVCVATVRTDNGSDALTGQLLRIAGSDAGDLAERLTATLGDRLTGMGAQASASPTDLDGKTVWTLDTVSEGEASRIIIDQVGDTLLLTANMAAMRFLAPLLMVAASPPSIPSVAPLSPSG